MSKIEEKRKYRRWEKARNDPSQICFGSAGELKLQPKEKDIVTADIPMDKIVRCPFCLTEQKLQMCLISTKKGISHSKAECKICGNGMMMRNLLAPWTPESYAAFVFGYRKSGFFKKIDFPVWNQKLRDLGWGFPFWEKYKALKAEEAPGEVEFKKSDYFCEEDQE